MIRACLPNAVTLVRLGLVAPVLWCVIGGREVAAFVLFAVAGLSDALDGWLARRLNARTALGAMLDPVADKLLVSGVSVALALQGVLPVWLVTLLVVRDLGLLVWGLTVRWRCGAFAPRPSRLSRVNTGVLVILVSTVLGTQALVPAWTEAVGAALAPVAAVTTVASGLTYAWHGMRHTARSAAAGRGERTR